LQGRVAICAGTIDFSGIDGADVSDGNGQSFPWSFGGIAGSVALSASWPSLPDQGGPIRTATSPFATLANPFVGTLTLSFSTPVELSLSATFASLLNDGLDGGRFERVSLSASSAVTFQPQPGTTAIYTGTGTASITADDAFSPTPTVSDWGFVGTGRASSYLFTYTSTRVGLSETFEATITAVPEPSALAFLAALLAAGHHVRFTRARLPLES
jgi:hypothetical protein